MGFDAVGCGEGPWGAVKGGRGGVVGPGYRPYGPGPQPSGALTHRRATGAGGGEGPCKTDGTDATGIEDKEGFRGRYPSFDIDFV